MEDSLFEKNWFYEDRGERKGPVSKDEIIGLVKSGVISRKDVVWKQGFSDWISIENTELNDLIGFDAPPPLSANNAIAWLLALMPIWGGFVLLMCFLISLPFGGYAGLVGFILVFMIYILLYKIDEKNIKKAGYNYDRISGWAWIVLPVYLYQRAKCLNQSLIHFWVWIGSCFCIIFFL